MHIFCLKPLNRVKILRRQLVSMKNERVHLKGWQPVRDRDRDKPNITRDFQIYKYGAYSIFPAWCTLSNCVHLEILIPVYLTWQFALDFILQNFVTLDHVNDYFGRIVVVTEILLYFITFQSVQLAVSTECESLPRPKNHGSAALSWSTPEYGGFVCLVPHPRNNICWNPASIFCVNKPKDEGTTHRKKGFFLCVKVIQSYLN